MRNEFKNVMQDCGAREISIAMQPIAFIYKMVLLLVETLMTTVHEIRVRCNVAKNIPVFLPMLELACGY
jgi:hypothetical protein